MARGMTPLEYQQSVSREGDEELDYNGVTIVGRLAVSPEHKTYDSGAELMRLLVTVRVTHPRRRVDVIPVTYWRRTDMAPDIWWERIHELDRGARVMITGSIQRRFWESPDGRRSRLEVVAWMMESVDAGEEE